MNRLTCLQTLIKQRKFNRYLEIGVANGQIFFNVNCTVKMAVDPDFMLDNWRILGKIFVNPYNVFNRYFNKTSDDFFREDAPRLYSKKKGQIALIDGMHEFAFALRDVENSLRNMTDDGVIILHDCNPLTSEAACSFVEWKARGFKGDWSGDVWKTVLYLRACRPDLTTFVLDCDYGIGVVTKKPSEALSISKEDIDKFTFDDFSAHREKWLNLKPADYFYEYFGLKKQ